MKPAYSVVEANGQDIQSVKVFPDQDTAVAHAIALARDNQADETDEHLTRIFEDDGYWDQGEWRISVVSIADVAKEDDAIARYRNLYTDALRQQLAVKEAAFAAAGGRGVELADEIDAMRKALEAR